MRWCGHPPVPSDHLHAGAGAEPVVSDDVSVPDGLHVGHESNPRLYGFTAAAHRANHRAAFPDMQAAARQKRRCAREDEQNGSQTGAPGASTADNGQTAADGIVLRHSSDACAAAHPNVLLHAIKQLLAQVFAITGGRGPTGRLHLYFVGGYDDGGRASRSPSAQDGWIGGQIGSGSARSVPLSLPDGERLWRCSELRFGACEEQKTEPDQILRPIRFWCARNRSIICGKGIATAHAAHKHPLRRNTDAGAISFFSPKNVIRNSQAGLLTQHQRPMQPSQPFGQWYLA